MSDIPVSPHKNKSIFFSNLRYDKFFNGSRSLSKKPQRLMPPKIESPKSWLNKSPMQSNKDRLKILEISSIMQKQRLIGYRGIKSRKYLRAQNLSNSISSPIKDIELQNSRDLSEKMSSRNNFYLVPTFQNYTPVNQAECLIKIHKINPHKKIQSRLTQATVQFRNKLMKKLLHLSHTADSSRLNPVILPKKHIPEIIIEPSSTAIMPRIRTRSQFYSKSWIRYHCTNDMRIRNTKSEQKNKTVINIPYIKDLLCSRKDSLNNP